MAINDRVKAILDEIGKIDSSNVTEYLAKKYCPEFYIEPAKPDSQNLFACLTYVSEVLVRSHDAISKVPDVNEAYRIWEDWQEKKSARQNAELLNGLVEGRRDALREIEGKRYKSAC